MAFGKTIWTYFEGSWRQGNYPILGAADHGAWQGTMVFDGARAFEGVTPDLDRHCARVVTSAERMGMNPCVTGPELVEMVRDGVSRFEGDTPIYIRPMMWSRDAGPNLIVANPDSTAFAICLEDLPFAPPTGIAITTTQYRRPMQSMMPTDAKAGCLYPNNARMLREVRAKGFDNAIVQDAMGNVAESATANIFMGRGGEVFTPVPNGVFLNGITRQRVIKLLRDAGVAVHETVLTLEDFRGADEIFMTGNAQKVTPVTRFDERKLEIGRFATKARELYWEFAHA